MADAIGPDERLEILRDKLCTIVANDLFRNSKPGEQITSMVELEVVELTEITSGHLLCASTTTNLSCHRNQPRTMHIAGVSQRSWQELAFLGGKWQ